MARPSKTEPVRLTTEALDDLEEEIELLKVSFERYFNGVDRVPPTREHDTVKLHMRNAERARSGSTVVRFRMQNLKARFISYQHYWTRILRQIEEGTFRRVLAESKRREFEAIKRRSEEDGSQASQSGVHEIEREVERSGIRARIDSEAPTARALPCRPASTPSKRASCSSSSWPRSVLLGSRSRV